MSHINGLKKRVILGIAALSILISAQDAWAKDKKDEEEKPFIEAQNLSPKSLTKVKDREYDEGVLVKAIEIEGNNLVRDALILDVISTKKGEMFDKSLVKEDLKKIYETGYFTDKIKAVPRVSSKGVTLKIKVEENVPITGFQITGNNVVDAEEISSILNTQANLPQNILELNRSIKKIEELYAQKGYILARVEEILDDPDGVITVKINEGVIDQVNISGNTRTKDFVIRRNLAVESGMVYNENILKQDLSRLFNTQAFGDVRRVIAASENDPSKYNLTIEVDEKRTGTISAGGGVDTRTGLFGSLGYTDRNFLGNGQQLSVNFTTGSGMLLQDRDTIRRNDMQLEARFLEPRFMQTMNSLETTAFIRDFASFQVPLAIEKRVGTEIEVARPIKKIPHLAGSVSMGFEHVSLKEGDADEAANIFNAANIDISQRANQLISGTFISLGPSLIYDTRDSIINTRSGVYSSVRFKESIAVGGEAGSFGNATASIRRFIPVGERSSFTIGGKVGGNVIGDLPEFAAFRLGGARSIRGFNEGNVGNGEGYMMTTAELRTPIPFIEKVTDVQFFKNMRLAFFMDAGTTFRETLTDRLYNRPGYGISAGGGLRIMIPGLGPLSLDYGIPLTNVGAGNSKNGRFTFFFGELY